MTVVLVQIIYGLTQANVNGWGSDSIIATLLFGFALFPVFYCIELCCKPIDALKAHGTWKIRNFALLNAITLAPSLGIFTLQFILCELMRLEGAGPMLVAVRFLPMSITAITTVRVLQAMPFSVVNLKWRIICGELLAASAALMISFSEEKASYWALFLPAFIIGPAGVATLFTSIRVALSSSVPPEFSGVAGGIYSTVLHSGIVIGLAITSNRQVLYRDGNSINSDWNGHRNSFASLMSGFIASALATSVFFVDTINNTESNAASSPTGIGKENVVTPQK